MIFETKYLIKIFYLFLRDIPDNTFNMIYGDPDYNVGINYSGKSIQRNGMII